MNLSTRGPIHPIFDKKEVRIFPCCLHLCVVILVSISVMSALSFPYRVGTPRAFINMASLYIYLCGDDTTRVFYISGVVCVKFVNRQV